MNISRCRDFTMVRISKPYGVSGWAWIMLLLRSRGIPRLQPIRRLITSIRLSSMPVCN